MNSGQVQLVLNQTQNTLSLSDIIQIIGILAALLIGIASIIISIITIRQNSKMIEESTRPIISVYTEFINTGLPMLYLIVKNFGQTTATITKFNYDFDFVLHHAYMGSNSNETDYLKELITSTLAPNQSRICLIEYKNVNTPVTFDIEYKTNNKIYKDKITLNLKAGTSMLIGKSDGSNGDTLEAISYTLQEMLQKNL